MFKKRHLAATAALLITGALAVTGCSGGAGAADSGSKSDELKGLTGVIGSKDFSEQYILAYLTTDLLNAHGANLTTNTKLVGSANTRQALIDKQFLGYWEYTGTAWITYLGNTKPITDPKEQFSAVADADLKKNSVKWMDPAPLNNTYAFAVRSSEAKKLGVKTLSDVAALPKDQQTFCIESEFSTRDDGWPGLAKAYGIDVPASNVKLLDTGVIYTATQKGSDCNFGEVFQTDGRIKALDLTVMKDDKQFFPVYQGAFTMQDAVFQKYPKIADVMAKLSPLLTTEQMQELNAKVDVDGEDPADVAKQFLKDKGLI
ncbi:glycine betaine ABC transporter substrate-binding protein [Microbacterium sp. NPDC089698]|jgi:osmoprotectant transport system substrate-binding protein|uniref:glycine betaine ABC transporter substrate-binding protein n=1 Tax=unclassified Microbacterium TaxID=2609290 RepID=UPI002837B180|nr:glycine betaine ABC transporter substrate-binding protein [Microbacterium sp.]MDR2322941.1 glycine betaine ABC transporter substrate-binding protein [Microbacterium sp.]